MELVIRNARLRDRQGLWDIGIQGQTIAAVTQGLKEKGQKEIDAAGRLAAPTFIDPHVHLDKALISEVVRPNVTGTLNEAIEIIWDKKKHYTIEDIRERAERVVRWAACNGTTVIRTHVDVDSIGGLKPLQGLLEVRQAVSSLADIQIVAFPQEGILKDGGTEDLMLEAMKLGADVVGGMPYNEMTPEEGRRHIDICFEIAKKFDADIDMHVDETDDPHARTLEYLATCAFREGYKGRVTAGHTCAMASYDDNYAAKVIDLVRKAEMNMITNPATNLMLQGRRDKQPIRRGITRVKELMAAGVNVCYGQDCLKDTFYPTFGRADLLEVGLITAHAAQLSMPDEIEKLFDMPTHNAAKTLRLKNYGLKEGCTASLNLISAETVQEAFRTQPDRLVIRNGQILAERLTDQKVYV